VDQDMIWVLIVDSDAGRIYTIRGPSKRIDADGGAFVARLV